MLVGTKYVAAPSWNNDRGCMIIYRARTGTTNNEIPGYVICVYFHFSDQLYGFPFIKYIITQV